jgi:glutamyl-tRNA(Gln) amidotransferase subunit E
MYPETDIPLIRVTDELLAESRKHVPRPWKDTMKDYMSRYGLNEKLAGQILDSNYLPLFENVCSNTRLPPTFVAVSLTESLVSLSREGLDTSFLTDMRLSDIFSLVDSGAASKESVLDIMRFMCQNRVEAEVAANRLGIRALSEDQLRNIVSTVVTSNMRLIEAQGDRSFGALMGEVMRQVRGKVDGGRVSEVLKEEIRKALAGKR